jgi:prepilin-type N-terminal cleavage/methylation domain-containing protein/prepilin-type processing-associated H-X9-DG protein
MKIRKKTPESKISKAFTLVELLVGIAIVGILAALLFPVISRAKIRAKCAISQNNLRQITAFWVERGHDIGNTMPYGGENGNAQWAAEMALYLSPNTLNSPLSSSPLNKSNRNHDEDEGQIEMGSSKTSWRAFGMTNVPYKAAIKVPKKVAYTVAVKSREKVPVEVSVTNLVANGMVPFQVPYRVSVTGTASNKGLIRYYPFNKNLRDEGGEDQHGILHGAELASYGEGQNQQALVLNGRNYLKIPAIQNGGSYSISLWVKRQSKGGGILEIKKSHEKKFILALTDDGKLFIHCTRQSRSSSSVGANTPKIPLTGINIATLPMDKWTHIYVSLGAQTMVYLDGALKRRTNLNTTGFANAPILIGAASASDLATVAKGTSIHVTPKGWGGYYGPRAIDGDRVSIFHGDQWKNHTFTIDLGRARKVSRITMLEGFYKTQPQYSDWVHGIINRYGLECSMDGIKYKSVFAPYQLDSRLVRNNSYTRTFPETEGRFWRITATGRFGVVTFTSEIELWAESFFKGGIDETRIYNRHLTPEEIMELYKCDATYITKYRTEYRIKYKKVVTKETRYVWQTKIKYETRYRTEYVTKYITKYAKKRSKELTSSSYSINGWAQEGNPLAESQWEKFYTTWESGGSETPIFTEGVFPDVMPRPTDKAPSNLLGQDAGMSRICINRYGNYANNVAFFDGSVRSVKLSDLWKLPWHQGWQAPGRLPQMPVK